MKQKKLDGVYINVAKQIASLSHCVRSKVGAVLVKGDNLISMGYNGTPHGMDNRCEENNVTLPHVVHAEINAIVKAARTGNSVDGSTLYLTLSPCIDCSKLILQAGIKRVVYLETYRNLDGPNFLKQFIPVEKHEI